MFNIILSRKKFNEYLPFDKYVFVLHVFLIVHPNRRAHYRLYRKIAQQPPPFCMVEYQFPVKKKIETIDKKKSWKTNRSNQIAIENNFRGNGSQRKISNALATAKLMKWEYKLWSADYEIFFFLCGFFHSLENFIFS